MNILPFNQWPVNRWNGLDALADPPIESWPARKSDISAPTVSNLPHPAKVISLGGGVVGVYYYTSLLKSLTVTDTQTITGLLTTPTPDDEDAGAFTCPAIGQKIWLEITVNSSLAITAASIQNGDAWTDYGDPIRINSSGTPYQDRFFQIIAEIVDPATDGRIGTVVTVGAEQRKIVQILKSNLRMELRVVNGALAMIPVFWHEKATA